MDDERYRNSAFIGNGWVKGPIRGVVLVFHGLGDTSMKIAPNYEELEWAHHGALVVMPYYGPWSWMNRQARSMVDELIEAVYARNRLADAVPLILTGGSMGGFSSLLYARYARRPARACQALYPACDLTYHFREREDVARTVYHAFLGYAGDLPTLLEEHSPLHQVGHMPDIPYQILQGDADKAVRKAAHADPMVEAMRRRGLRVEYLEIPGMGHYGPTDFAAQRRKTDFVLSHLA